MKSTVYWFIDNPIAANLLMLVIAICGIVSFNDLGREVFPRDQADSITISATYSGASPREIEAQIIIRFEEAIADLPGIAKMESVAIESQATIQLEVSENYDVQEVLNEVQTRIDSIDTLPDEVDKVSVRQAAYQRPLMSIAVYGNVSESLLKETGTWLQQEFLSLDAVSKVELNDVRDREMTITIPSETLQGYDLSFDKVSKAIQSSSVNTPAGTLKSGEGDIQVQSRGQAFFTNDFANIVLSTDENGSQLRLGDIAEINDSFAEQDRRANFNGYPVAYLRLFTSDPPDVVSASQQARETLMALAPQIPPSIRTEIWFDWSQVYQSRMDLLLKNTLSGLILVFIILMLFLRPSLALWVCIGIATSFLGAISLLPLAGVTLNMVSMFGFLMVLGIVVDDAIVVGESIHSQHSQGLSGRQAAKEGTSLIMKPVILAVVSTIIFFSGMFGLEGEARVMAISIAIIVIASLLFSLIESLWILPSHLSHAPPEPTDAKQQDALEKFRHLLARGMAYLANVSYQKLLRCSLKHNRTTLLVFIFIFLIAAQLFFFSGYLKKSFSPIVPSSRITITAYLPDEASFEKTKKIQDQIEQAAYQLSHDEKLLKLNNNNDNFIRAIQSTASDNRIRVRIALTQSDQRQINVVQVKDRWRELIGPLKGVKQFDLRFTINQNRKNLRFLVSLPGSDSNMLKRAVETIKSSLGQYQDIVDIEDTLDSERIELELHLKPYANLIDLTLNDVARQVRQAVSGQEVQTIPRDIDDIDVVLRLPKNERSGLAQLQTLNILTPNNLWIPLNEVVDIVEVPGYTKIQREDRRQSVAITANVTPGTDSLRMAGDILDAERLSWQQQFRGLSVEIAGAVAEEKDFNQQILINFTLAFIVSFGLMAIIFRSFWQPFIILTAIPFGFVGGILGHLIFNQAISLNSLLGFIACAGVVVNDNLVLLDRIHKSHQSGCSVYEAITQSGIHRFRAIILTSITTFIGLMPILFETSIQSQFLIPMVISLAFGVLFATIVTLILVPNLYWFGECLRKYFNKRVTKSKTFTRLK